MLVVLTVLVPGFTMAGGDRYWRQHALPDGRQAVVAEGEMEPRSIGSYSVRLYRGTNEQFSLDMFLGGIICRREGTVEGVEQADIDADSVVELVVIMRCAGSGGYLSADAVRLGADKPVLLASVSGLDAYADVLMALRAKVRIQEGPVGQRVDSERGEAR
jgi:hypothetical protein